MAEKSAIFVTNELITLMGSDLLQQLLSNIHQATWYAVIADETADIATQEQLSLSIRWVNKEYTSRWMLCIFGKWKRSECKNYIYRYW